MTIKQKRYSHVIALLITNLVNFLINFYVFTKKKVWDVKKNVLQKLSNYQNMIREYFIFEKYFYFSKTCSLTNFMLFWWYNQAFRIFIKNSNQKNFALIRNNLRLIAGSKTSSGGKGKPLHWTSCLKIADDLATGLLHIHQNPGLTHGNIKSSNVLLSSDFESCFTDYGLVSFKNPNSTHESNPNNSLLHRAPECSNQKTPSQQSDVYSFGVLLLELLTGNPPSQALISDNGSDIPKWVNTIREEQTESSGETVSSGNEKLAALLNIAMGCVSVVPDNRPAMKDVLKMIRETRAEAGHVACNSSDHSPGRWSDTVQSLPRDNNHNHLNLSIWLQ